MQGHTVCQVKPALFRPDPSKFPARPVVATAFPEGGRVIILIFFPRGNPVKFTDPDGREAWEHTSEWTDEAVAGYSRFVTNQIDKYEENGRRFTCEDLALSLLIDYASLNGLPVKITNKKGTFSSDSDAFRNMAGFKNTVLRTTGAHDLIVANTVKSSRITPGDLILMDTGIPGDGHDYVMSHTQIITDINFATGTLSIAQGNTNGRRGSNPKSIFYIGTSISRGSYNMVTGVYSRGSSSVADADNTFSTFYRKWNFEGMN
jgi:hypothetical protein